MMSSREIVDVKSGDVIDNIWELDGVWIKNIEGEVPNHPLLQDTGDGTFRLNIEALSKDYECPVEIPGLMTIED